MPSAADPPLDTFILLRAFVDELVRCGLRCACTSPGSRSAPLVLALTRAPGLQCFSHVDERCAGFFAVGLAKAARAPVAVACTSGTAAAELAPAVVEAWEARVPLLILTADRPPELREVGAGQTIDQLKLYGTAAKWFFEVGTHDATADRLRWIRALACRAFWTALDGRPGPVHLNWPLREPLIPPGPLPPDGGGRPGGRPWVSRPRAGRRPQERALASLAETVSAHPRGVIVAGRNERHDGLAAAARRLAERAGYPLLADPLSGARGGAAAVAHYDILLRHPSFAARHQPELVIRVGDLPISKPLRQWLTAARGAHQVAIEGEGRWQDPDALLSEIVAAEPGPALAGIADRIGSAGDPRWLEGWLEADARAASVLERLLADEISEPAIARELGRSLPPSSTLFVASSMPVRDVETFWPARDEQPRLLANRGANGIDGTVSAAFGAAAAGAGTQTAADGADRGGPTVLLIGDVALAHDIGGLLAAPRLGLALTIVVLNNGGGGIFDFLPVSTQTDVYEEHVATPTGLDLSQVAALYGLGYAPPPPDLAGFASALDGALRAQRATLVEVRTDRGANVELHRRVWDEAAHALG